MEHRKSANASRTQLVLIVVIALASLGGAWLLYFLTSTGDPWATSNHGAFVNPPLMAHELGVRSAAGDPFSPEGDWWIWVVPAGPCDRDCEAALHQVRQVHVLLNREAHRVRRALVSPGAAADASLLERYPRLALLSGNLAALERGVYLVDPEGRLVLRYVLTDAGEPVLDDLKRLLKVSQIG